MGGKKDKKKNRDPDKKAALAAKKEAKADKAALKRLTKEQDRLNSLSIHHDDREETPLVEESIDSLLENFRKRTQELTSAELEVIDTPFPSPPRGNFTWTLCPTNGMFYMFGGEYYDGAENLVFDELLRWDPDAKRDDSDETNEINGTNNNKDDTTNKANKGNKPNQGIWTRILTPPPHPPPRCAHSAIYFNDGVYIFGGECATAEKYHHYKDLWRLDVKRNVWEEIRGRGSAPAARSGHRAALWRHSMILFGGFHEALRTETKFFNDLHIFDFQTHTWAEVKFGKLARIPPARSGCILGVSTNPEGLFVFGGYSKLKNANAVIQMGSAGGGGPKSEGITHVDCWMLPLKPLLNPGAMSSPPSWERIPRKGEYPSPRAGTSAALHKNKLILFGGVIDQEGDHHKLESVFYDDLFALDMERRRWFALRLKQGGAGRKGKRRRRKKDGDDAGNADNADTNDDDAEDGEGSDDDEDVEVGNDAEAVSSGWGLDKLRHDMFAFIDGDGNIVYEKIEDDEDTAKNAAIGSSTSSASEMEPPEQSQDQSADMKQSNAAPVGAEETKRAVSMEKEGNNDGQPQNEESSVPQSKPSKQNEKATSKSISNKFKSLPCPTQRQTPLPRINCASLIKNNTLYIYGGVLEVGDREVTLDDCWSLDLNSREKWTCIWEGVMHRQVWKGVESDDEGSYISTDRGGDYDDDEEEDDEDEGEDEGENMLGTQPQDQEKEETPEEKEARKKAKKALKKEREKEKRRGIRHEIKELNEKLGVDHVDHEQRTPHTNESMAEFYARTSEYWEREAAKRVQVSEGDSLSIKEMKREGFGLAKERYEELKPILERLKELEEMQREGEEEKMAKREKKEKNGGGKTEKEKKKERHK